jgi:beta-1,4-mannosyl-glycoprotein beta-1,4-N-acetylglucosaminyltransferase
MLFDCFTFFNELDLLELRLETLSAVVDRFVLVEADLTHQGAPKPLHFAENRDRFARWLDRIAHVVVELKGKGSWERENEQRRAIVQGLGGASADDLICLSDLDEIPNPDDLAAAKPPCHFDMYLSYYWLNCRCPPPCLWNRSVLTTFKDLHDPQHLRQHPPSPAGGGGWHFSYLGGVGGIINKLQAFAHIEYSQPPWTIPERIAKVMREQGDLFDRGGRFQIIPIDDSFPRPVQSDPQRWSKHIHPISPTAAEQSIV